VAQNPRDEMNESGEWSLDDPLQNLVNADYYSVTELAPLDHSEAFRALIVRAYHGQDLSEAHLEELALWFRAGHRHGVAHEHNSKESRFFRTLGIVVFGIIGVVSLLFLPSLFH
jgi:hypothetical protein